MSQRVPSSSDKPIPVHDRDGADETGEPSAAIRARVRARQVEILDGDFLSGAANIPAAAITGFVFRNSVPAAWIYLWVAVMAAVIAALLVAIRGPHPWRADPRWPKGRLPTRLAVHVFLTTAVGAVWGGGCLIFGPSLPPGQMMFLMVIVLGCNAACVSALGPYLPAFFGYAVASLFPLAYAYLLRPDPGARNLALLVILFMATISLNVRAFNRHVLAAFRLRAENEGLAENLARANAAAASATRSKWNTLAHIGRELRTPMNAILGFSEMMREQRFGPLDERYLAYSDNIHDSGRHTLDLIDAIGEVSRAEAGRLLLNETDVMPLVLVAECMRLMEPAAAKKDIALESRFERSMPSILVDRQKLRQALLNLLSNAINYTPEGGRILVVARRVNDGFDIVVADNGVGIAAEDLERCLEPFIRLANPLTAEIEGAGLGLPLARHLVELHGGRLELKSEPGRGTEATIHLPSERWLTAALRNAG